MPKQDKPISRSKAYIRILIILGVLIASTAIFFAARGSMDGKQNNKYIDAASGNLVIPADGLSSEAAFFPYEADGIKMEVLALKASDGTIRTAFNTCQVCYSSGRGYYKLDGTTLVCQNCGNRFLPDQVELEKGGCNPVPITSEYKEEKNGQIVITKDFLSQASVIFKNWKK